MTFLVTVLCLIAVIAVIAATLFEWKSFFAKPDIKKLHHFEINEDSNICASCESKNLQWLNEGHYLCRSCGHEGGQGMERALDQDRLEKLRQTPLNIRQQSAAEDLQGVTGYIESALQFGRGLQYWTEDTSKLWDPNTGEAREELEDYLNEVAQIEQLLNAVHEKLFHPELPQPRLSSLFSMQSWRFEVWKKSFCYSVTGAHEIAQQCRTLKEILEVVISLRNELPPLPSTQ